MRRVKKIIVGIAAVAMMIFGGLATSVQPAMAGTCPSGSARETYKDNPAECNLAKTKEGSSDLMTRVKNIVNVVLGLVSVVAVIMIIIGGVTYATSRGDAAKVKKGKDTILYSVIGLIVSLLAFAIVNFVLSEVFKDGGSSSSGGTSQTTGGDDD